MCPAVSCKEEHDQSLLENLAEIMEFAQLIPDLLAGGFLVDQRNDIVPLETQAEQCLLEKPGIRIGKSDGSQPWGKAILIPVDAYTDEQGQRVLKHPGGFFVVHLRASDCCNALAPA